jgi:hypothetical protein
MARAMFEEASPVLRNVANVLRVGTCSAIASDAGGARLRMRHGDFVMPDDQFKCHRDQAKAR